MTTDVAASRSRENFRCRRGAQAMFLDNTATERRGYNILVERAAILVGRGRRARRQPTAQRSVLTL
jgi:hypothetical protein